jgi:hypothetical protein
LALDGSNEDILMDEGENYFKKMLGGLFGNLP